MTDLSLNRMKAALKESEDKYRNLVSLSPDPIVVIQNDQRHVINQAFTNLFGYTQQDVDNGLNGLKLIQEQDKERIAKRIKKRFAGKDIVPTHDYVELMAKDGKIKHCETYASLIQYNGQPADLVILRDITERREAENALRASEEKYRLLAENVVDNIWVLDAKTLKITFCSPSAERMLGYTDKEIMGHPFGKTLTSESMEVVRSVLSDELSQEGKKGVDPYRSRTLELEQIHKDGSKLWTEITATFLRDKNGKANEILGVTRDISERKKAEESIRLFRNLVNQSNDAIFVVDPQTSRFLDVNDKACSTLKYEKEELLALGVIDIEAIIPDDFTWEEHVKNVRKQKGMLLEGVHKRKDGTTFPVEVNTKILEEEEREYMVAVARDISQRKQAEEEIAVFKQFAEASEQGLGMADLDGGITYANAALCRQLGEATSEDARGKNVRQYYPGGQRERLVNEILPAVMEQGYWTGELDLLSTKGNITHTIQSIFLIRDKKEGPLYLANVITDITERRQTEERIHTLTQELITAQENERQRISRELHDHVAQDLAASKMTCGLILNHEGALGDDVRQEISRISDTLGAVITDVRDLSYDLRPPDLEEWGLARSISLYCEDFSQKSAIEVEFHPTGIDHLILKTDSGIHIFRMIQEGLNNIWRHADASRAYIKLLGAFPNLILRIEDNGKGFDVSRRMVQVMEEKRMGLRNMEERARLLHGQMNIQSRPGIGTKISIKFPYAENRDEPKKDHINP